MQRTVGLLALAFTTCFAFPSNVGDDQCDPNDRVDCGHVGTDQQQCEASGCCWQPGQNGVPWCFFKKGKAPTCPLAYESKGEPFSAAEVSSMRKFFTANINVQGSGAVVAAPDHNTPGGSYYYHWERDGALSMRALLDTADSITDELTHTMESYVGWVKKVQSESDPHGQSVLTEPKYFIPNGTVYSGPWCRPQPDGPALRAQTLVDWAMARKGNAADLWPMIRTDLDYVEAHWSDQGCDLWEEIRSEDFFWNRFNYRSALTKGAAFAKAQGDTQRQQKYSAAAQAVAGTLSKHYSGGFVYESTSRPKDSAVICAFNDGYLNDGVFGPTSKEVAGTVKALNELFCSSFTVNQKDTQAGVPGILYGRYAGDNYAGGNPWILLTAALAQLLYRGATELASPSHTLDATAFAAWAPILGLDEKSMDQAAMAKAMAGAGDGVLMRLRAHVKDGGFHLTEQIDRNSGVPMGAKDLTWSYATMLKAVHARKVYTQTVAAQKKAAVPAFIWAQAQGPACNQYDTIKACEAQPTCAWSHWGCVSKK